MKTYLFRVELQQEEDGRWSIWIPALRGLASWGHTREEALRNIHDAAEAYVEDMIEVGLQPHDGQRLICDGSG